MANLIVAFGFADNVFFIASEYRYCQSYIPDEMMTEINTHVHAPYEFVSLGDGKWFVLGRDPNDTTRRLTRFRTGDLEDLATQIRDNPTNGVCFGPDDSWTWFRQEGRNSFWKHEGLEHNAVAFINTAENDCGSNFRIIIGAGNAAVMVFSDGFVCYHSCGHTLADTLSAAGPRRKNLPIRYIALSPAHFDWFFIQFRDSSVTWSASGIIDNRLREFAKYKRLARRKAGTLEVVE